ncbi:hypothetical protein PG989_007041 [Apiospora arundinis]
MQFTLASILLASLATLGSAAPLNNNETLTELELVERGAPKAYCAYKFHPTFPYVGIYVPNNLMSSAQGTGSWGGGFIDNLRGKETAPLNWCNPRDWQAQLDDAGTGIIATFNTLVGCHGDDVARALHAASGIWTICPNDLGANAEEVIAAGVKAVELLGAFLPKKKMQ